MLVTRARERADVVAMMLHLHHSFTDNWLTYGLGSVVSRS